VAQVEQAEAGYREGLDAWVGMERRGQADAVVLVLPAGDGHRPIVRGDQEAAV